MKIAIDIDNTLLRCRSIVYDIVAAVEKNLSFGHNFGESKIIKKGEARIFANKHRNFLFGKLGKVEMYEEIDGSVDVINKLCQEGNQVVFLSNRPNIRFLNNVIMEWLEKNQVQYDFVVMNCGKKAEFCKEHGIELLIDDSPRNCVQVSREGITSILLGGDAGKIKSNADGSAAKKRKSGSASPAKIYDAKNWAEVLKVIENNFDFGMAEPEK